jgi:hypothetical protein
MLIASLVAIAAAALVVSSASAGKKKKNFLFDVTAIKLTDDTPENIEKLLNKQLAKSIKANERLMAALEEGAPDPATEPKKFKKYLKKNNLGAFDVHVEVLAYEHSLEKLPEPRTGQMLTVRIQIRMYGITVPGDVLAFSGEGSATVKLELGKRLRKRDSQVANHDAIELAVDGAIADSIKKLDRPKKKPSGK